MSNNLKNNNQFKFLTNQDLSKFSTNKILLIGAGNMGAQYANALYNMKIKNVTILSNSKSKTIELCKKFGFTPLFGGFEKHLPLLDKMDLVIITPVIHETIPALKSALKNGQDNILVEKPISLHSSEIKKLSKLITNQRVRVGYNRLVYPNYHKLKQLIKNDGGITSIDFSISERIHKIPFKRYNQIGTLSRYGVYVTIHVMSIVYDLIGFPKKLNALNRGKSSWHPTGSIFVGTGINKKNIPFTYHGDWNSTGKWYVQISTKKNTYRLMPLEELNIFDKIVEDWKKIDVYSFPNVKFGIIEELILMLDKKLEKKIPLTTLSQAVELTKFTEKIFNYK